ncbi:MAG: hypothetical protein CL878_14075 [Dehalococcoidia bacterium]|nr:hypothetical protein [Dehalococcoidia bacterium]
MSSLTLRIEQAKRQAAKARLRFISNGDGTYLVQSQSADRAYLVRHQARAPLGFICECEGYFHRGVCTHIATVAAPERPPVSQSLGVSLPRLAPQRVAL